MKQAALAVAVLALSLASCASTPTADQLKAADYGTPIDQATAEGLATDYLQSRLKDPMSAVYSWKPVYQGYLRGAPIVGRPTMYGYLLDGQVNAKNSYGGYTGAKPYQFLFHDGRIVYAAGQECMAGGGCYMAPLP